MKPFSIPIILHMLSNSVICCHKGIFEAESDGSIYILEGTETGYNPNHIYIGDENSVNRCLFGFSEHKHGFIFIVANSTHSITDIPAEITLIETDLNLIALYNKLQKSIQHLKDWESRLQSMVLAGSSIQKLLETAVEEIPATVFLLNPGYKKIAAVYREDIICALSNEIQKNGFLSIDTLNEIRSTSPVVFDKASGHAEIISPEGRNYIIMSQIRYLDNLAARIAFILPQQEISEYICDLCKQVTYFVTEHMFSNQGANYGGNSNIGSLIADLIECRLTDPAELEQRLQHTRLAVTRYYHAALFRPIGVNKEPIPWNYIINQLESIFPMSNITTYRNDIVILVKKTKHVSRLPLREDKLLPILEQHNAYIAIGNASEFLTSLPPVYHQVKDTLRFGTTIHPEKRIYYYEDYSVYQIIELAAEAAQHRLVSRNPVHLCNNELISLILYDRKNNTDLVNVLAAYLQNECNSSETAKQLYIHRNTMLYKIKKIEEVMGATLDNHILRDRLRFSLHVVDYMCNYKKDDLLMLKRNPQVISQSQEQAPPSD